MVMDHASTFPFAEAQVRLSAQDEFVPDVIDERAGCEDRFRKCNKVEEANHLRQRLRDLGFSNVACNTDFGVQDRIGLKDFCGQLRVIKALWRICHVHRWRMFQSPVVSNRMHSLAVSIEVCDC